MFQGAKVPGSKKFLELLLLQRKFQGTKVPESESYIPWSKSF